MSTIVISGVNRGLGRALFTFCRDQGHRVYGIVRSEESYRSMENDTTATATVLVADLSIDGSIEVIRGNIIEPVDLVINNAGIPGRTSYLENIEPEELLELFNIHCVGALRMIKALKDRLLAAEAPMVININSRLGSIGAQVNGVYDHLMVSYSYRIAKAAQNMLTACLHKEFGQHIRFVSLHPGSMRTSIAQVDAETEPAESAKQIIEFWKTTGTYKPTGIVELPNSQFGW